jgi:hypothetical protein
VCIYQRLCGASIFASPRVTLRGIWRPVPPTPLDNFSESSPLHLFPWRQDFGPSPPIRQFSDELHPDPWIWRSSFNSLIYSSDLFCIIYSDKYYNRVTQSPYDHRVTILHKKEKDHREIVVCVVDGQICAANNQVSYMIIPYPNG